MINKNNEDSIGEGSMKTKKKKILKNSNKKTFKNLNILKANDNESQVWTFKNEDFNDKLCDLLSLLELNFIYCLDSFIESIFTKF